MFVVTQSGLVRSQKRFDYPPATFALNNFNDLMVVEPNGEKLKSIYLVIASFTHHLLVYQDFQLQWAAKTDHVCHAVQIGTFGGQKGLIVTLNDQGWLQVLYLGTEVLEIQNELQTSSKLPYSEMDQQYLRTVEKIAQKEGKQSDKNSDLQLAY